VPDDDRPRVRFEQADASQNERAHDALADLASAISTASAWSRDDERFHRVWPGVHQCRLARQLCELADELTRPGVTMPSCEALRW
jgi:hypothetical protein